MCIEDGLFLHFKFLLKRVFQIGKEFWKKEEFIEIIKIIKIITDIGGNHHGKHL